MANAIVPVTRRRLAKARPAALRRKFSSRRTLAHAVRACLMAACLCVAYSFIQVAWRMPYVVGFVAFCIFMRSVRK